MAREVVLAFAFGAPYSIVPNKTIGKRAIFFSQHFDADIFTQKDVPATGSDKCEWVTYIEDLNPEKKYVSTLDIVKSFIETAKKKGWKKVIVVATPQHKERCYRDLRKSIKEENSEIPIMQITLDDCSDLLKNWYDKNSTQWWTRSCLWWWLREIPLRLMPWRLYKKIAS